MSQNNIGKKDGKASISKQISATSEATEIIVPKLVFAPISNFHKWKKQLLKKVKKEYGPIHDSIVSEQYPNFIQESMQLILTSPEDIFKEMLSKSKSSSRKSITAPGQLSFLHSDTESSDDESSDTTSLKGPKSNNIDESDDLEASSPTVASLLKMSSKTPSSGKGKSGKRSTSPLRLTDQQLKLIENYIAGKQKIINDLELYFIKNLPSVSALIISTFSVQAETKVRQHRKFEKAYGKDDVVRLLKIIQECAVLTPLDIPNLANQLRKKRDKLYQEGKQLDYFCELFNQFEKDLVELDRATPEDELIVTFLNHLHPSYCSIITQWKMTGIMPLTLDSVQYKLQQYESLAISQSSVMKTSGKQLDSGVQDVAMVAQHGKNNIQKGSANRSLQQTQSSKSTTKKEPMTEERAKSLGLKKLPCCGKFGSHKPSECRNPTKKQDSLNNQPSVHVATESSKSSNKSKSKKDASDVAAVVALKGPAFYDDDNDFALVITSNISMEYSEDYTPTESIDSVIVHPAYSTSSIILYLDTGASSNAVPAGSPIIFNVHDIPSRDVIGIGQEACTQAGFLEHFGSALILPKLSVHLISLSAQRQRGMQIRYDQAGNFFDLCHIGQSFRFTLRSNKLYGHNYTIPAEASHVHLKLDRLINGKYYTEEQFQRASAARTLHCRLDHPSDNYLRFALSNGTFLNCSVTAQDVSLAVDILGPCPGCNKGKATHAPHPQSTVARATTIGERVYADIAYVDQQPILVTIDEASNCILAYDLKGSKSKRHVEVAETKLIAAFRSFGHTIRAIHSDSEATLLSTEVFLNSNGTQLFHSLPGRHCALVERAIRTIKSRARAVFCTLPYTLPPICRKALFLDAASCCNLVPTDATGGRSPREVFTGIKLDASIHLRAQFGDYVHVKTPWTTSKPQDYGARAEDGIVVGRDLNSKGGIKVFLLNSNQILPRDSFTPAVLTDAIIARINNLSTLSPLVDDPYSSSSDNEDADHNAVSRAALPIPGVSSRIAAVPPPSYSPLHQRQHRTPTTPVTPSPSSSNPQSPVSEPSTDRGVRRYPVRQNRSTWQNRVFNLTFKKAQELYGDLADTATKAEVTQLVQFEVWELCKRRDLSLAEIKRIIPCSLFLKEKLFPDGTFDKLKARLVAGGHRQDITLYDNISSPTVSLTTVYMICAIGAYERLEFVPIDIKGAYLNAALKSVIVHMRIPAYLASLFIQVYRELNGVNISEYIEKDGSLLVQLKKALYGLVESALLWYEHLKSTLVVVGYKVSEFDRGLFYKITSSAKCFVCIHVDDILIAASSNDLKDELMQHLQKTYKDLNVQSGNKLFYLGLQMDINRDSRSIRLSQSGYVADLLREYPVTKSAVTPATDSLFDISEEGTSVDSTAFASKLMKLSYLAKRTRPDLLLAVSFLATRMKEPNHFDELKLTRVYEYLSATKDYYFTLQPTSLRICAWIDASYAVHSDARSHTGIMIGFGANRGLVYFRSSVQKIVSDSSTYAELIAQHDGIHTVLWMSYLMKELGYSVGGNLTPIVYQDNNSAIHLAQRGPGVVARSKHFRVRFFYVKQLLDNKIILMEYTPTKEMKADFYTKPNQGRTFHDRVWFILGFPEDHV